jgi:hypothetical protein
MYEGSMYGAGMHVFAVWGYVISHTRYSTVELHPKRLSDTLGGTVEQVQEAIEYLCKPDPHSRFKEHDGKKLIKEGEFQFFVPSWASYRKIKNDEDRREYNRKAQAEHRERQKAASAGKSKLKTYKTNGGPLPGETLACRALENGNEAAFDHIAETSVKSAQVDEKTCVD